MAETGTSDSTIAAVSPPSEMVEAPRPAPWWRRRVPMWVGWAVVAVSLVAGCVGTISAISATGRADDAEDDRDEVSALLADTRDDLERTEERLATSQTNHREALDEISAAERRAREAVSDARAQVEQENSARVAEMDARQSQQDQREADLGAREAVVASAEGRLNANSFGDGVFEVGVDIQPGRYHSNGPSGSRSCYWAMLGEDGRDIIDNNLSDGPQTIIINSPFFESSGCGTWVKTG